MIFSNNVNCVFYFSLSNILIEIFFFQTNQIRPHVMKVTKKQNLPRNRLITVHTNRNLGRAENLEFSSHKLKFMNSNEGLSNKGISPPQNEKA